MRSSIKHVLVALSLLLPACATVPSPVPIVHREASVSPQTQLMQEASWSLLLPVSWEVKPSIMDEDSNRFLATGEISGQQVVVAVNTLRLDDDVSDEEFGDVTIDVMYAIGVKVIDSNRTKIDGKQGTIATVSSGDGITTFQYAVATNRIGHLAVCGGRHLSVTILQQCKDILNTLKVR